MADFETIRSVSGARASQIDEGLRAHMNKVYGTMSVGMIITALAAWAISGLATTSDPALAVGQMQNGTMLTGLGAMIYTSPLRWVIMFAPLIMIFGFGAVMRRSSAQAATAVFLCVCYSNRRILEFNLHFLHHLFNNSNVFGHSNCFCWVITVGLYNKERYFRLGFISHYGSYRTDSSNGY